MTRDGVEVALSPREFALLQLLMERPGTILSRAQIEERLYGWGEEVESNAVEVHIHGLRRKLGAQFILTVRGVGYRVRPQRMRSLRARLLAWLLGGVVFVGAAGGCMVYRNALAEADAFFDYHLRQTALILRDQPVEYLLLPQIPPADAAYDFVVQVWSLDGVRVYLSRPHAVLPQITTLGFATVSTSEGRWRVFGVQALTQRHPGGAADERARAARGRSWRCRPSSRSRCCCRGCARHLARGRPGAASRCERLTALVQARRVDAARAAARRAAARGGAAAGGAHSTSSSARLNAALERERAFMADAAHELRTPLTALHLQTGHAGARQRRERARRGHGHSCPKACSAPSAWSSRCWRSRARSRAPTRRARGARSMSSRARSWRSWCRSPMLRRIDLGLPSAQAVSVRGDAGGAAHAAAQSRGQRRALHPAGRARRRVGVETAAPRERRARGSR